MPFSELESELCNLKDKNNLRSLRTTQNRQGAWIWMDGKKYLNLSGNDYLGLAGDISLQQQFLAEYGSLPLGASASRLLSGNHESYTQLETKLAKLFNREGALVFNSGYHANTGILSALLGSGDCVFADRRNHASLIDGIRLSGAKLFRYHPHDPAHLSTLLEKHRSQYRRAVIATESIFSMDGDRIDLQPLCKLKSRYQAWLYVDEAHAFGVSGTQGLGECEAQGVINQVDFIVGTFGKALAALGAFVVADLTVIDYLINTMRPFIFTTALPPMTVQWIHFLVNRLASLANRRDHLVLLHSQLRRALHNAGLETFGESQIVPIMIGDNEKTLATARILQNAGYLVFAIRPPTVPANTARLRLSLSAAMSLDDLAALPQNVAAALADSRHFSAQEHP